MFLGADVFLAFAYWPTENCQQLHGKSKKRMYVSALWKYLCSCLLILVLDTELLDSLREDLAAAGIPNKALGYLFKLSPSELSIQNEEPDFTENSMEIDSMDIDPMEIDEDEELLEPELPVSEYSGYDYESNQEMIQPSSPFREQSSTPLIKVSQQIGEYDPLPTTVSDGLYSDDDADEGLSVFEASIIVPDPVFPQRGKLLARHSLGFGDDELLAEQVRLAATSL